MEHLFEKISVKLIGATYRLVSLIDIKTQEITVFSMDGGSAPSSESYSYETIVTKISSFLLSPYKEQLRKKLQFSQIVNALDKTENDVLIEFEPALSNKKGGFFLISFSWYDETKSSVIMTVSGETRRMSEKLGLIQKLRRIEDRFDFLRTHICEDFIEVNIYTGQCTTIHSNNNMVSKSNYKEQIEWFANHLVAEEERAAYLEDFDLDNLLVSLRNNDNYYTVTYTLIYQDGRHDVLIVSALIQDSVRAGYEYIVSYAQDITLIKQQEARNRLLEIKSRQDPLTELYNREAAEYLINKHLIGDISGTKGTLAIIDIDYFKQVNDNYGHAAGDLTLIHLARSARDVFRSLDVLCRWGGDEFLVFLKNTDDETIITSRFDRLRVKMLKTAGNDTVMPVTLSIGIAVASQKSTFQSLFKLADENLYTVKNKGRDGLLIGYDK